MNGKPEFKSPRVPCLPGEIRNKSWFGPSDPYNNTWSCSSVASHPCLLWDPRFWIHVCFRFLSLWRKFYIYIYLNSVVPKGGTLSDSSLLWSPHRSSSPVGTPSSDVVTFTLPFTPSILGVTINCPIYELQSWRHHIIIPVSQKRYGLNKLHSYTVGVSLGIISKNGNFIFFWIDRT